jgi:Asp-tRNA(Asn)/Glu-tRNA(Gln) amidotransferase A subunit family amidase
MAALISVAACHKGEQAVAGVAQTAVKAEQNAQAKATERDNLRAQLAGIPLPTKSLYVDIHEPSAWSNPFISVGPDMLSLRIILADANTSSIGQGTMLRPAAARRQEVQLRPSDLAHGVAAIPASAWPYGRVIAIAESPADAKQRPMVRRNVEAAIQQLNDLGIVVQEWPSR